MTERNETPEQGTEIEELAFRAAWNATMSKPIATFSAARHFFNAGVSTLRAENERLRAAFEKRVCNCGAPRQSCNFGLRHEAREYDGGMGCATCPDTPRVVEVDGRYYCTREILDDLVHQQFDNDCLTLNIATLTDQLREARETTTAVKRNHIVEAQRLIRECDAALAELATLRNDLDAVLCHVSSLLDGWHADGTAWSEWDETVRKEVSEIHSRIVSGRMTAARRSN